MVSQTTIYGRIVRVGGVDPRVAIEQSSGKTIYCRVKDEVLARKLGERLYYWAGLFGLATIDSDSLGILDFRVDGITQYDGSVTISEAFNQLKSLAGKYYEDVSDVQKYVSDLRS